MRNIFVTVSKVFGLVQIYYGLFFLVSTVPMVQALCSATGREVMVGIGFDTTFLLGVGSILGTLLLTFGFAWLLICKAEWLADVLKIPKQEEIAGLSKETLLMTGIILVGLYVSVQSAPIFMVALLKSLGRVEIFAAVNGTIPPQWEPWTLGHFLLTVVPPALQLALGLLLTFYANKVFAFITRDEEL